MIGKVKITPKPVSPQDFKNFYYWNAKPRFEDYIGKIIYCNTSHPGKHIYKAFYIRYDAEKKDYFASPMCFILNKEQYTEYPLFTLEEMASDSIIIFKNEKE